MAAASDSKPSAQTQAPTAARTTAQQQQRRTTTAPSATASAGQPSASFLRILRAFLTRAARTSPSLSDLRAVLASIFAAYTFEETLISLANRFLEKDVFEHVEEAQVRRQRGWRPKGQVCEGCRKRVWGPGAGAGIWDAWEKKRECGERDRLRRRLEMEDSEEAGRARRGKGKAECEEVGAGEEGEEGERVGPLVVFACRHLWHQRCVEKARKGGEGEGKGGGAAEVVEEVDGGKLFRCPLCVEEEGGE